MSTKTLFTLPSSERTNDILVSENINQTLSNKKFKDSNGNEYTIDNIAKLNTSNTFTGTLTAPSITLNGNDLTTTLSNCAKLDTANTFTANQTINGNLYSTNTSSDVFYIFRPNDSPGNKWIHIGSSDTTKNKAAFGFKYSNNESDNNCACIWINSDAIRCYPNRAEILKPLTIDATISGNYPLNVYSPSISSGTSTGIRFGKTTGNYNCGLIAYDYTNVTSDISVRIGLWGAAEIKFTTSKARISHPLDVNGNVTAKDFVKSSDIRKKENIQELKETNENLIDRIKLYSFNLVEDTEQPKRTHYGVIAQELQEIMPELIYDDGSKNHYLSVDYMSLIPHMINKIKSQQKIINDLNNKMNEQNNKINQIFETLGIASEN